MIDRAALRHYGGAWMALVVLTALSFGASYLDIGAWHVPVALAIALAKGAVVVLIFMHLYGRPFSFGFTLIVSLLLVLVFVALTVADPLTRGSFVDLNPGPRAR